MVDFTKLLRLDREWNERKLKTNCECGLIGAANCYWWAETEPSQQLPDETKLCKCECHVKERPVFTKEIGHQK